MIDFEKFFEELEKRLAEVKFPEEDTEYTKAFNAGAQTMFYYGRIALMDVQNEYNFEKIHAGEKVSA